MPGSTQKCPTQTQHASVDFAIIKHPAPSLLKSFSNFIQAFFFFKEPIHSYNKITTVKTVQQQTLVAKPGFHNALSKIFVIRVNNH